jgi:small subunit ribosomal protein S1
VRFTRDLQPIENQCFVIMPFGAKELDGGRPFNWDDHYRRVIEPAVADAGMVAQRADDVYGNGILVEDVWKGIQRAEVVLADLSGRNANVMYELGLAHVIGKKIVMMAMGEADLPADLRQFRYLGYSPDDGLSLVELSRDLGRCLRAIRAETGHEQGLVPLMGPPLEPVRAVVETVTPSCVIVRAENGRRGLLAPEDVSWSRLQMDMTRRFKPDQALDGAFVSDARGEPRYSLIALTEDPWPKLRTRYPEGHRFVGRVTGEAPVGVFVHLEQGVTGLIRRAQVPSGVGRDAELEVVVKRIEPEARRVELSLLQVINLAAGGAALAPITQEPYVVDERFTGQVHTVDLGRSFTLVAMPRGGLGILHVGRMGADLEARFRSGALGRGTALEVVVDEVDAARGRVVLRDTATCGDRTPSAPDGPQTAAA